MGATARCAPFVWILLAMPYLRSNSLAWFAATAVLVLIAICLFTMIVAAFEIKWGLSPSAGSVS